MAKKLGKKDTVAVENYHPYICTPAYDGKVDIDYALSLAEACFCSPLFQVQVTASIVANGAFIDLARNQFVKWFLEQHTDCTHLFFIDGDLKFPANAFIGLARAGLPICAGAYRRRQKDEDYPVKYAQSPEGGLWVKDDWVMCDRVPTGFLCIRRDIIEEMAAEAPKVTIQFNGEDVEVPQLFYTGTIPDTDDPTKDRFLGEDFAFCNDYVKKYGEPIPVWPNIDFVHGGYKGNFDVYLENKIKEEDERGDSAA